MAGLTIFYEVGNGQCCQCCRNSTRDFCSFDNVERAADYFMTLAMENYYDVRLLRIFPSSQESEEEQSVRTTINSDIKRAKESLEDG